MYYYNKDEDLSQSESIGCLELEVNKFNKQEEFDIQLEIPDKNNTDKINLVVYAKALFIWSFYDYYLDQVQQSEEKIKIIKDKMGKTKEYLPEMTNLKFIDFPKTSSLVSERNENKVKFGKDTEKSTKFSTNLYKVKLSDDSKKSTNFSKSKWYKILKITVGCYFICAVLLSFNRTDIINWLASCGIAYSVLMIEKNQKKDTLKIIGYLGGIAILYDWVWLLFCSGGYLSDIHFDRGMRIFSFIMTLVSDIVKIAIGVESWLVFPKK